MDAHAIVRDRLAAERGTILKDAPERVALLYPSPYHVGMSSLGFQTIYREINDAAGRSAERAFLPDDVPKARAQRLGIQTYESLRPLGDFPVVAVSIAYELEIAGLIEALELANIPVLAEERGDADPIVLCGGPLTNSNPLTLAPFADAIVMGEADESVHSVLDVIFDGRKRASVLDALHREVDECYVPALAGDALPAIGKAGPHKLPAWAPIRTPNTELSDMFLLEAERGCSRGCAYCVMRRSTNGGMRIVPMEEILARVPADATKVGLVGAAVSDHPKIVEILHALADSGRTASLSSLRPDRLKDDFVHALKRCGARSLTTALDAASQRLRDQINRKAREQHLLRVAELTHKHELKQLKLYMMVGLPDETDEDIDELIRFATELSRVHPLALGIAPFVAKRNTPLDGLPFAGIKTVERRLERLRRGLKGRVDLRATSARWAWVEYVLSQGARPEGLAVLQAVRAGGRFSDYRKAFEAIPRDVPRRALRVVS